MFAFVKRWFERFMTEKDLNSRFIFFMHGGLTGVSTLYLVYKFVGAAPDHQVNYPMMVLAVNGTVGAAGVMGRFLTKKTAAADPPAEDKDEDSDKKDDEKG